MKLMFLSILCLTSLSGGGSAYAATYCHTDLDCKFRDGSYSNDYYCTGRTVSDGQGHSWFDTWCAKKAQPRRKPAPVNQPRGAACRSDAECGSGNCFYESSKDESFCG